MKFFKSSLKFKLTLIILILLISTSLTLGFLFSYQEEKALKNELHKRGISLVTELSRNSTKALLTKDVSLLHELTKNLKKEDYVMQVFILDPKGKVIMHNNLDEVGKIFQDQRSLRARKTTKPYLEEYIAENNIINNFIAVPIQLSGVRLGTAHLIYSHKAINEALYKTKMQIIGTSLIIIFIGIIITIILSNIITAPIAKLTKATREISGGNLNQQVDITSKDEIGELAASFNQMTSQLKDAQIQLVQSAKLASLGELAGGVAHEVNNPLASISTRAQLLLRQKEAEGLSERTIKYLDTIDKQAERAGKIVRDLLQFSRQAKQEYQPTDINTAIEETLSFTEHQISVKNINITKELEPNLPEVMSNKNQLQQVFLNMINNAADAMPDGGKLTIKTSLNIPEGENSRIVTPHGRRTTDIKLPNISEKHTEFIAIQISDTGTGISKENLDKILDPFFTTKEVGKGTGLGLSISHGIIEQHGGKIKVESEVGKGTTFTIKLPVSQETEK